jgi:hypothetical protein
MTENGVSTLKNHVTTAVKTALLDARLEQSSRKGCFKLSKPFKK